MNENNIPDWIVVPKRYKLVKYTNRWYEIESSLFFSIEYGNLPNLGSGFKVESKGWGTGSYRIYRTREIPFSASKHYEPELVYIPACEYWMDEISKGNAYRDPSNKKRRLLSEYWIGRKPVTIKQFSYFIDNYGYRTTEELYRSDSYIWSSPNGKQDEVDVNPNMQVLFIGLRDIEAYCKWLGSITGKKYRLPSIAEWENAYQQSGETGVFQQGEYPEWTLDYEVVSLGYDPECSGDPIYYRNKRMYYICGGTKSLYSRSAVFGAGSIGFRVIAQ
jgi:formylglycine-generating enzyme required for sulfatase activity